MKDEDEKRWHPRKHVAALQGMLSLTLEQRGAYNTLLDLIYWREGPIPDDPRWLCGWLNTNVRKWARLREELIAAGKIIAFVKDGKPMLMNFKATQELSEMAERHAEFVKNGRRGGEISATKRQQTRPYLAVKNDV